MKMHTAGFRLAAARIMMDPNSHNVKSPVQLSLMRDMSWHGNPANMISNRLDSISLATSVFENIVRSCGFK